MSCSCKDRNQIEMSMFVTSYLIFPQRSLKKGLEKYLWLFLTHLSKPYLKIYQGCSQEMPCTKVKARGLRLLLELPPRPLKQIWYHYVLVLLVSIYNISLQTLLLAKGINMVEGGPTPNVETPPPPRHNYVNI